MIYFVPGRIIYDIFDYIEKEQGFGIMSLLSITELGLGNYAAGSLSFLISKIPTVDYPYSVSSLVREYYSRNSGRNQVLERIYFIPGKIIYEINC